MSGLGKVEMSGSRCVTGHVSPQRPSWQRASWRLPSGALQVSLESLSFGP